jgi:tRNA (guanine10-N2)-dimethyltransferase
MVQGARDNLAAFLDDVVDPAPAGVHLARADAARLPLGADSVDAMIFDAPYGRQSKIEGRDLASLVGGALSEARRVADRGVLVADRPWESVAREAGWDIEARFERRVHRSLTRHVHVLD